MSIIERARENVASRYPEIVGVCPNKGTPVYNPCRRAILNGAWDNGKIVSEEVSRLMLMALPENVEE